MAAEVDVGIGDDLMAAGRAEAMWRDNGLRVKILDRNDAPRWHPVWDGNPAIARPEERGEFQLLKDCGRHRPYVRDARTTQWWWKPYGPRPATLTFTAAEIAFARDAVAAAPVVIEPHLKPRAPRNKDWGWDRWQALAARIADLPLAQLGPAGTRTLPGVRLIETVDFRLAAAVLSRAAAYVGHEGGLHHAAAAVRIPAVVIFGGFISPEVTGYADQTSLFAWSEKYPLGCGVRAIPCQHCADAMASIAPERVEAELRAALASGRERAA